MVSLRWLTLFLDFEEAQRSNWGQACLAYLYSTLDSLSMWGLGNSLRLVLSSVLASYKVCCGGIAQLMGSLSNWAYNLFMVMGIWISYNGKFLKVKACS